MTNEESTNGLINFIKEEQSRQNSKVTKGVMFQESDRVPKLAYFSLVNNKYPVIIRGKLGT